MIINNNKKYNNLIAREVNGGQQSSGSCTVFHTIKLEFDQIDRIQKKNKKKKVKTQQKNKKLKLRNNNTHQSREQKHARTTDSLGQIDRQIDRSRGASTMRQKKIDIYLSVDCVRCWRSIELKNNNEKREKREEGCQTQLQLQQ